jgi:Flp pilus assembly pilin Flp
MKLAFVELIAELYRDQSAVTTVEYALIAALVVVAALVAVAQLEQAETSALNSGKGYFEGGQ